MSRSKERFPGERMRHPQTEAEWGRLPVIDGEARKDLRAMWSRHWPDCPDGNGRCGFYGEARIGLALLDALDTADALLARVESTLVPCHDGAERLRQRLGLVDSSGGSALIESIRRHLALGARRAGRRRRS